MSESLLLVYGATLVGAVGGGLLAVYVFNARRAYRAGYRLGLERARGCAIYPAGVTYRPDAGAAYDDVFRRISTLIEEDRP